MPTITPSTGQSFTIADAMMFISDSFDGDTLSSTTPTSFVLSWVDDGKSYSATITGTGFTYITTDGITNISSGTVQGMIAYEGSTQLGTISNVAIPMTVLNPIIIAEDNDTNIYGIEQFFMSLDWTYHGTDADDIALAGQLIGDGQPYNPAGDDEFFGNGGNDSLFGGDGEDTLWGGTGQDTLFGGTGNDKIYGGKDDDNLYGGKGDDYIKGHSGDDYLKGHSGDDYLRGGSGNDRLKGGSGADKLKGDSGNDSLYGESGKDKLYGGSGSDTIFGGSSSDILFGGSGNDKLYGGSGNDKLYGGSGNDYLKGHSGNDYLKGHSGDDHLRGGSGNDRLRGNDGDDLLKGEAGDDTFIFDESWGHDTVADFDVTGNEKLDFRNISEIADMSDLTINYGTNDTVITFGSDMITLQGTTETLQADDFLFA